MLDAYRHDAAERAARKLPPLPLSAEQTEELCRLLGDGATDAAVLEELAGLLTRQVPPGVDDAARIKAAFLGRVARGETPCRAIDGDRAVELLGTMLGGYNVTELIRLLDGPRAEAAARALSGIILVFDAVDEVAKKALAGNAAARMVLESWAEARWFFDRPALAGEIEAVVFKVPGETNTDDLSPAQEAWSRPDIPLHAQAMLTARMPDAMETLERLRQTGLPIAFAGDVVGTGSSRKSAINSVQWHIGRDIPFVPAKRTGGIVLGGKIAPIFFNTAEDSGALPIECDVDGLNTGERILIRTGQGEILRDGTVVARFSLKPATLADEVRAGGRIPLIIGRKLTDAARRHLGLPPADFFTEAPVPADTGRGYTLAQKMVGRACGLPGVRPGAYCEPHMTTVASQDTTGAMTRDELKELACLSFSTNLFMQSFCHTAAYPRPVDVKLHQTLPPFVEERGGVALRPGDGVVHSWVNRMLLPDTVGTGGDSHTRFPVGISFPAGSGLVAFAAALGVMPLDMPESVLVRFTGTMQPGITLRDLVNAIPWVALRQGLLTLGKQGKKNVFSGRILEIEGLPDLKVEQAFELADASAERSAAACTVALDPAPVEEFVRSNVALLEQMLADGYGHADTIRGRIDAMGAWLARPELLTADPDAEYAHVLEIDMGSITEPLVACPNDPDDVKTLSEVAGTAIDDVFIGSCMTNIGHYRAAGRILDGAPVLDTRLWVAPPTRMDEEQLRHEGVYGTLGRIGARMEMPGCSLCMGNQARVRDGATVFSTSTRNFDNRMGKGAKVYLGSAELAAVCARLGRLPTPGEYQAEVGGRLADADEVYRYLQFDLEPAPARAGG